jgi:hypothetical protein
MNLNSTFAMSKYVTDDGFAFWALQARMCLEACMRERRTCPAVLLTLHICMRVLPYHPGRYTRTLPAIADHGSSKESPKSTKDLVIVEVVTRTPT